jgi:triacylglycerol lipase
VTALRCALVAMVATASAIATAQPAAAYSPYPVSFSFPHAVDTAAKSVTVPPLGANRLTCTPSPDHPYPVVLVHGLLANLVDNWDTMGPLLSDNGFCVYAFTYGADASEPYFGGLKPMEVSAQQLEAFVNWVLDQTHAGKVDLVGHSEGTVMPRYWMEFHGGAHVVDKYVMITPLWHGTLFFGQSELAAFAAAYDAAGTTTVLNASSRITTCYSCNELLASSAFMSRLNEAGMALRGVTYTDIVTKYDELVQPYTSGILNAPNVTNIVLQTQCRHDYSEHLTVAYDANVGQDVLNALDPARAKHVHCSAAATGVGSVPAPRDVGLLPAGDASVGPGVAYALGIKPVHVRTGIKTKFVLTASVRVAGKAKPLRGALVEFAQRRVRTGARGAATVAATLHRSVRPYVALLISGGRTVASVSVIAS